MTSSAKERVTFRDNPDELITLTIGELDDLVYSVVSRVTSRANNDLYRGLSMAYFNRWSDDIRTILDDVEQIKLRLDAKGDNAND